MEYDKKITLIEALFRHFDMESFLIENPEFSERMVVDARDEIIVLLQESLIEGKNESTRSFSLYVDGASQPQKKQAGIGGVIYLNDSEIESFSENIGEATNNEAEYLALLRGVELVDKYQPEKVFIFADSELIVRQIQGIYQVKNSRMQKLYGKVMSHLQNLPDWTIEHVPRNRNKKADQLSKQAVLIGTSETD